MDYLLCKSCKNRDEPYILLMKNSPGKMNIADFSDKT